MLIDRAAQLVNTFPQPLKLPTRVYPESAAGYMIRAIEETLDISPQPGALLEQRLEQCERIVNECSN